MPDLDPWTWDQAGLACLIAVTLAIAIGAMAVLTGQGAP